MKVHNRDPQARPCYHGYDHGFAWNPPVFFFSTSLGIAQGSDGADNALVIDPSAAPNESPGSSGGITAKGLCESGGGGEYGNADNEAEDVPDESLFGSVGGDDQSKPSLPANDSVGGGKCEGGGVASESSSKFWDDCDWGSANTETCLSVYESPGSWTS